MSEHEEGPRAFGNVLTELDGGMAHVELSQKLFELTRAVREQSQAQNKTVKGTLTLKLEMACEANGVVAVGYSVTTKEPEPKRARSIMWMTRSGNLTPQNPKQQTLPLREVEGGRADVREPEDNVEVREV